jgi:carboxylesterase
MTLPVAGAALAGAERLKPPVLLLHGLTGAPADMQTITRHLRQNGYRVEVPMLPGHGVSEAELLKTGWRDWLAGAEAELLQITEGGGRAFVGGLSMGAVLALSLAILHPDRVAGIVCFAPTLRYDGWVIPRGSWLIRLGSHIPLLNRYRFHERPPYGIKDERLRAKMSELLASGALTEAGLPSMPARSLAQNLDLIRWTKRRLDQVTAPLLIIHSTHDDITHVRNADWLADAVRGPVQKLYLEDSYHLVTLDRERNKVAKATLAFFQALGAADQAPLASSPKHKVQS